MHAEFGHHVLGVHQNVDEVRYRRALVAAHIANARLQQRLGDGENTLAAKHRAVAESQCPYFRFERPFHGFTHVRSILAFHAETTIAYPPLKGEGRTAFGGPGWGGGTANAAIVAPLSPPSAAQERGDLPLPGGRWAAFTSWSAGITQ